MHKRAQDFAYWAQALEQLLWLGLGVQGSSYYVRKMVYQPGSGLRLGITRCGNCGERETVKCRKLMCHRRMGDVGVTRCAMLADACGPMFTFGC